MEVPAALLRGIKAAQTETDAFCRQEMVQVKLPALHKRQYSRRYPQVFLSGKIANRDKNRFLNFKMKKSNG